MKSAGHRNGDHPGAVRYAILPNSFIRSLPSSVKESPPSARTADWEALHVVSDGMAAVFGTSRPTRKWLSAAMGNRAAIPVFAAIVRGLLEEPPAGNMRLNKLPRSPFHSMPSDAWPSCVLSFINQGNS